LLLLFITPIISIATAEVLMTPPIGINKVTCLTNSDTIVGIPFRKEGSRSTLTSGAPLAVDGAPDYREIPLSALTLEADSLSKHYLHFTSGARDGRWYNIVANSSNSVTIDLNGDSLDGVVSGDRITIAEYWTLDTLFPPDQATTGWAEDPENPGTYIQNGHAIVASSSTSLRNRKTRLFIPDTVDDGINFAARETLYIANELWYNAKGDVPVDADFVLSPDSFITISHPVTVTHPTHFRSSGEVLLSNMSIPLHSISSGAQDNHLALQRPVDIRIDQLNLIESGAFTPSNGTSLRNRKDVVFLYDNSKADVNRSADKTLYHDGTTWRNAQGDIEASDQIVPASAGFIIRKASSATPVTIFWQNQPTY